VVFWVVADVSDAVLSEISTASETLITNHQNAWRNIPENQDLKYRDDCSAWGVRPDLSCPRNCPSLKLLTRYLNLLHEKVSWALYGPWAIV
jgi:hypothetical protein